MSSQSDYWQASQSFCIRIIIDYFDYLDFFFFFFYKNVLCENTLMVIFLLKGGYFMCGPQRQTFL